MKPRFLLLVVAFLGLATAATAQPLVVTQSGTVAGTQDGSVTIFKGIPYAAPPVGPLRWEPPAPPATWSGNRDAGGVAGGSGTTARAAGVHQACDPGCRESIVEQHASPTYA